MSDSQMTEYFRNDVLNKRPYLTIEWCAMIVTNPLKLEIQREDGRIRYWGYIKKLDKYFRVVTLEDGVAIHNAFPDRGFKP